MLKQDGVQQITISSKVSVFRATVSLRSEVKKTLLAGSKADMKVVDLDVVFCEVSVFFWVQMGQRMSFKDAVSLPALQEGDFMGWLHAVGSLACRAEQEQAQFCPHSY